MQAVFQKPHDDYIDIENRRLLQDRGVLSRIFETAATARRQVGVMLDIFILDNCT